MVRCDQYDSISMALHQDLGAIGFYWYSWLCTLYKLDLHNTQTSIGALPPQGFNYHQEKNLLRYGYE